MGETSCAAKDSCCSTSLAWTSLAQSRAFLLPVLLVATLPWTSGAVGYADLLHISHVLHAQLLQHLGSLRLTLPLPVMSTYRCIWMHST